ncbi:Di-sulfide bridge nucleocytoplasmic transport domain-containing protein [Ephemerocybe angulata]|uniref:Di-sulfide bridge nucleocytoplasmic transport domain-containing protein n=1 Tax=Ephemerocybe angulata TaxID=980116 RepID=A0A8H6I1B4_9AGAR|nr:Di-sulfide bridge nucleocytoplasmic transport domain-containing protein [Tulosesus angulatus]
MAMQKGATHQKASIYNVYLPEVHPSTIQIAMSIVAKSAVLILFVICCIATSWVVGHDLRRKASEAREIGMVESDRCRELYNANYCGMNPPFMRETCQEWFDCSERDNAAINRLSLLGNYVAEACNSLVHGMSWQSKLFVLAFAAITLQTQCVWGERLIQALFTPQ